MARVNRIGRAKDLLPIYQELAPDLKPVILHSQMKPASAQREALAAVRRGDSKIVICVNMLGEGFDLPSLKVAAMHDPHKSLGITLQFIGRFARSSGDRIDEASVIVGRTDPDYDENLKKLYAEDADWNHVINNLSAAAVGELQEIGEFEQGFRSLPEELSLFLIPEFHIAIAQPGVSKVKVSPAQLNLLASTEIYVKETADSGFTAFTSK